MERIPSCRLDRGNRERGSFGCEPVEPAESALLDLPVQMRFEPIERLRPGYRGDLETAVTRKFFDPGRIDPPRRSHIAQPDRRDT